MTNNQSNKNSQLNHVDLSLYEFLGTTWKDKENRKSNPEALEMLLIKTDGIPKTNEYEREEQSSTQENQLQTLRTKSSTDEQKKARKEAIQDSDYTHVIKLTYPTLWYTAEVTTKAILHGINFYTPQVYNWSALLWTSLWIILLTPLRSIRNIVAFPVEYCLDLFCEKPYRTGQSSFRQGYHETRFWIGRGRGNTYLKAIYQRFLYVGSYFSIHKFYVLDQFVRRSFTIRRGFQAVLPIGITSLIVQRTIITPQVVYSKSLEKTSKTFGVAERPILEKFLLLEDSKGTIDPNQAYFRNSDGILFTREYGWKLEFVEGKFKEVQKELVRNITHPNELLEVFPVENELVGFLACDEIGYYEWSSAEELSQMPVVDENDETEPPPFTPEPVYKRLKQEDATLLKECMEMGSSTNNKKSRQRIKQISDRYMQAKPRTGQFVENETFKNKRYKPICIFENTDQVQNIYSVEDNLDWKNVLGYVNQIHDSILTKAFQEITYAEDIQWRNGRFTFSPFGINYHTDKTNQLPLKPSSRQENKLFHYSFPDSRVSIEALNIRPNTFGLVENEPYRRIIHARTDKHVKELAVIDDTFCNPQNLSTGPSEGHFSTGKFKDYYDDEMDEETLTNGFEDNTNDLGTDGNNEIQLASKNQVKQTTKTNKFARIVRFVENEASDSTLNEEETVKEYYSPLWFPEATLFLSPHQYEAWQDLAWKGIVLQLLMYAGIELCVRMECRGVISRDTPIVNDFIAHIDRMPEAVRVSEYIGEKMKTPPVKKLLLAFQTQRGIELYGYSPWMQFWNTSIRPNLSSKQETKFFFEVQKFQATLVDFFVMQGKTVTHLTVHSRTTLESTSFKGATSKDILPRYSCFNSLTKVAKTYFTTLDEKRDPLNTLVLKERQELFNRLGGEAALMQALQYGETVQNELRQLPLLSLIKPGTERMRQLPKGMILLGEPGNGRTYFVRTLATASRLPLLITESNRYLNEVLGLVRLKTLFKRARAQAPNILFIRDLDFMTRHRERYPMFSSVRATTQLLMAMDGYSRGTETIASQQNIFIMGSMTTTSMMDDACMRSGRFEWVLDFYYPPVNERHQMLLLHSQKSMVNNQMNIDWPYFSAMTEGFSCLDLRVLVNTSAVYVMKEGLTNTHTKESMAFALGSINQVHDLPQTRFVNSSSTLGFFPTFAFNVRHNQPTQYGPFFTQTGKIPMYKKLMHLFRNMIPDETETLQQRWNTTCQTSGLELYDTPPTGVVDGLLPLLCEGLFIYNAQKTVGAPYPVVTFETYCCPLFFTTKDAVDLVTSQHTLERITKEHMFVTSFDLWRRTQTPTSYSIALTSVKSIDMRTRATALLRTHRFSKQHSLIGGLNEVQYEMLFGAPPITNKIKQRLAFLTKKPNEFASRDANIFGTFETNTDLAFKCRKETTGRRVDQVAMEIVKLMQKNWRQN